MMQFKDYLKAGILSILCEIIVSPNVFLDDGRQYEAVVFHN
jgi:hypothetical protein